MSKSNMIQQGLNIATYGQAYYSHEETEEQQGRKLGEAQIFFVIATIIHFLVEIAIEPCWDLITVIN